MPCKTAVIILVLGTALLSGPVYADNMQIRGTLVEPPSCKVVNLDKGGSGAWPQSSIFELNFGGRVVASQIDKRVYRMKLNYQVECPPGQQTKMLILSLGGDNYYGQLKTNIDGLRVRFIRTVSAGETSFDVGREVVASPQDPPMLEAMLVREPGATLKSGPFYATATLTIHYF